MSKKDEMTPVRYAVILAMADCNLNICAAARKLGVDHTNVRYHIERIIDITGKDPRKFYELVELVYLVKGAKI